MNNNVKKKIIIITRPTLFFVRRYNKQYDPLFLKYKYIHKIYMTKNPINVFYVFVFLVSERFSDFFGP